MYIRKFSESFFFLSFVKTFIVKIFGCAQRSKVRVQLESDASELFEATENKRCFSRIFKLFKKLNVYLKVKLKTVRWRKKTWIIFMYKIKKNIKELL